MKQLLKNLSKTLSQETGDDTLKEPTRLFVHIPKTAGTSFRTSAESRFGEKRVLRDYGPESAATSKSVLHEVYEAEDTNGIQKAIVEDQAVLLAGHFAVQKYGRIIGLPNTVTFFRDPVEQVISHYRHAVAHHGYEDSLLAFAQRDGIRNIQTRFLFKLDPALIGIVGLTESYRDSLELINVRWDWSLKYRRKNVSDRFHRQGIDVTDEERAELKALNKDDYELYLRACQVFENSLHCLRNHVTTEPRGALNPVVAGEAIGGWALDMKSEDPTELELWINGTDVAKTVCTKSSKSLKQWRLPRGGDVEFLLEISASTGDIVEIRDTATGLVLDRKAVQ